MRIRNSTISNLSRNHVNGVIYILTPAIIAIFLRLFCIGIYKVQSSSMAPTLLQGDIVLVSKMRYGARFIKTKRNLNDRAIIRIKGLSNVKKSDIVIFNKPIYSKNINRNFYGEITVKRCFAVPGDCTKINTAILKSFYNEFSNEIKVIEPYNQEYSSFYIPLKGVSIGLNKEDILLYDNILEYDLATGYNSSHQTYFDNKEALHYTFQHDYYFMIGDNFYHSQDSRHWGLVPDDCIIGKAAFILFSYDSSQSGLNKVRWTRIFKLI